MPTTSPDNLRYPASTQPPNVPVDMSNLAADVQAALTAVKTRATTLETKTQDGGWRNIITSNMNGTNWGGSMYLRRVGDVVTCTCYTTTDTGNPFIGAARTGTAVVNIPTGFKPVFRNYQVGLGVGNSSGGPCWIVWDTATSRLQVSNPVTSGNWAAGNFLAFNLVWFTNEAQPGTQPGVAV